MDDKNEFIQKRRFLDPSTIKVKLKDEVDEDEEEKKDDTDEKKKDNEKKKVEKNDNKSNNDIAKQISDPDSNKTPDMEAGEEEELKQIKQYEKTVQIRLCNYSMLMRA